MKPHANSHENDALHHLYEIFDVERGYVFKFGICGKPLLEDGSSIRANEQVALFNRVVGMSRFFPSVLVIDIQGRKKAEEIEEDFICNFIEKYGFNPPGNLPK
jgi:URI fold toxin 2